MRWIFHKVQKNHIFEFYALDQKNVSEILAKYKGYFVRNQFYTMQRNRAYLGYICYGDLEFKGKHPAIISDELFNSIQCKLLEQKYQTRPNAQSYSFLLSGILYCHCGNRLGCETAKSGKYAYYSCNSTSGCKERISAPKLEKSLLEFIEEVNISQASIDRAIELLRDRHEEELTRNQPEIIRLSSFLRKLDRELNTTIDSIIGNKSLSASIIEKLNQKVENIEKEKITIESQLNALKTEDLSEEYLNYCIDIVKTFKTLSLESNQDPFYLRQVLLSSIEKVELQIDGSFLILPSIGVRLTVQNGSPIRIRTSTK